VDEKQDSIAPTYPYKLKNELKGMEKPNVKFGLKEEILGDNPESEL
jgi:hypothetical protein